MHGNSQLLAGSPERFPERIIHTLEAFFGKRRRGQHDDATMAALHTTLDLGDDDVDLTHIRNNCDRHISIAHFAPFRQRVIVGSHARKLESGVSLQKGEIGNGTIWIEYFAVDAI